jgi:hypothetical protein
MISIPPGHDLEVEVVTDEDGRVISVRPVGDPTVSPHLKLLLVAVILQQLVRHCERLERWRYFWALPVGIMAGVVLLHLFLRRFGWAS